MKSWRIHITGRVQGVGFRPYVKQQADAYGLKGWVKNTSAGVEINVTGDDQQLDGFLQDLNEQPPSAAILSSIEQHELEEAAYYDDFRIASSSTGEEPTVNLTPDIALCEACRRDLHDPSNRRYTYPFITCTDCGPRYSIIDELPYDRVRTRMLAFDACPSCQDEYLSHTDRRFHSQTNACASCGVQLEWLDHESHHGSPVQEAIDRLKAGQVVAVKGTGGFLLLADASNEALILALRDRKSRPAKPFACLFPDIETVERLCQCSEVERKHLMGLVAPIVLLETKATAGNAIAMDSIAPGLDRLGVMLPSNALLELIAKGFGAPLLATSGNVSGAPICYTNKQAKNHLATIADVMLGHNLSITTPLDDSVMSFSRKGSRVIHRRSRGLAPEVLLPFHFKRKCLALGAEMKSSFALTNGHQLLLSQALGDTSTYDAQIMYKQTLDHLLKLMSVNVQHVFCDLHPDYFTSQWAMQWKDDRGVEIERVQHHKAHLAALLYDRNLLTESTDPLLGFVWDGTGYGDDGNIWGSEVFLVQHGRMDRVGHLEYAPLIANQRMMKEPPVALLALSGQASWVSRLLPSADVQLLQRFYAVPTLKTSSMGRLFDAVAALLLGVKKNCYEGEAAMRLQRLAMSAEDGSWQPFELDYRSTHLSQKATLSAIHESKDNYSAAQLALRFHQSLVAWVSEQATLHGVRRLAFTGGVFQNTLLIDLLEERLGARFNLFFHQELPPNDESVALGQIVYSAYFNSDSNRSKTQNEYVFSSSR